MNNNPQRINVSQNLAKFKNCRSLLLLVLIFSTINVILPLAGVDLVFFYASFIGTMFSVFGSAMAIVYGNHTYAVVGAVLSVLTVVPYLICYILSNKRKVGSMTVATVLFGIDTLIMAIFLIAPTAYDDLDSSLVTGLLVHILIFVMLIFCIVYARKTVEEEKAMASGVQTQGDMLANARAAVYDNGQPVMASPRLLKIERQKKMVGCAANVVCYVNGVEVCRLKNGQKTEVMVDSNRFEFAAAFANGFGTGKVVIGEGTDELSYRIYPKMGMIANSIEIERM